MLHLYYTPVSPLLDFVDDFWLYDGYTQPHFKERILPSGTIELVINLRDDELRIYDAAHPNRCNRFSGALVSGAYGGFFVIDTAEEASIMGVHFKPGGAFPFLGLPAGELADVHVNLETLWGRSAMELRERLCGAATPLERFRLLEEALLAHLFRPLEHHYAVPTALDAFGQTDTCATVRDVARHIGLSQRRFIQVFTEEVGLTPKLFSRVRRFQQLHMIIVNLLMRWLHIFSVITAVGATVFLRLAFFPALAAVADETRKAMIQSLSSRLRVLIHAAIGGILLSGFYNTRLLSKTGAPPYGIVYAVKMAVSLTVFVIAILITSGKPRYAGFQANWERWLGLNLALAVIIVALSAWLRYLH